MTVEQGGQGLGPLQTDLEGRGLFEELRPAHRQGSQRRVGQPEERRVLVFDDSPQLLQDQIRLEFKRGGQGVRDLQQRGLLAGAGFDALVKALLLLDAPADVPDDAQQARPTLVVKDVPRHEA